MSNHYYRAHCRTFNPLESGHRMVKRKAQPPVHRSPVPDKEQERHTELSRLAAGALAEAERAERRGRPVIAPNDGTSIKSLSLRLLVAEAKKDLARLSAIKRAQKRAEGQEEGSHTPVR